MNTEHIAEYLRAGTESLRARAGLSVYSQVTDKGIVTVTVFAGNEMLAGKGDSVGAAVADVEAKLTNIPRIVTLRAELSELEGTCV
jgi:hypothetical protein